MGDEANLEQQASQACRQLVAKKVSGVFFAPLELTPQRDTINRTIAEVFDKAGIPIVLLDRDLVPIRNAAGMIWLASIIGGQDTRLRLICSAAGAAA